MLSAGYIVEKKDEHSDNWVRCNDLPCIDTKFLVPDLVENSNYQFRVAAVNAAGPSDFSPPTSSVKVKEKIGWYKRLQKADGKSCFTKKNTISSDCIIP